MEEGPIQTAGSQDGRVIGLSGGKEATLQAPLSPNQ